MNTWLKKLSFSMVSLMLILSIPTAVKAFSLHNEETDGDLSDEGLSPTPLGSLSLGTNSLKATFNNPGFDYFTFNIPKGQGLKEIILRSWNTNPVFEDIAFMAIKKGTVFDFDLATGTPGSRAEGLLGWSHLRSPQQDTNKILFEMSVSNQTPESVGLDLIYQQEANSDPYTNEQISNLPDGVTEDDIINNLRNLASTWESGATGFDLPLSSGDYVFWLRQGSDTEITVELDFNTETVPEPSSVLGTLLVLGSATFLTKKGKKPSH